jgi:hypothetical protein
VSIVASTWAWTITGISSTEKIVLLCLADHHNGSTGRCDPAISGLINRTSLTDRTIQRALRVLARLGLIKITSREGRSSAYQLQLEQQVPTPESTTGVPSWRGCHADAPPPSERHPTPVTVAPKPEVTGKEPGQTWVDESANSKDRLFSVGLAMLAARASLPEARARTIIGQLLKAAGGDAGKVFAAIASAEKVRPVEPVPWLFAAIRPRRAGDPKPAMKVQELPCEVSGWLVQAVVDKVLDELGIGDKRFPSLPMVVAGLLREGFTPDVIYAAARTICRGRAVRMQSPSYLVAIVRNERHDYNRSPQQR